MIRGAMTLLAVAVVLVSIANIWDGRRLDALEARAPVVDTLHIVNHDSTFVSTVETLYIEKPGPLERCALTTIHHSLRLKCLDQNGDVK